MQTRGSVREETVYERLSKQTSDGCIVSLSSHSGAAVKWDSCLSHIYRYRKKIYIQLVWKKQCKYIFIYIAFVKIMHLDWQQLQWISVLTQNVKHHRVFSQRQPNVAVSSCRCHSCTQTHDSTERERKKISRNTHQNNTDWRTHVLLYVNDQRGQRGSMKLSSTYLTTSYLTTPSSTVRWVAVCANFWRGSRCK